MAKLDLAQTDISNMTSSVSDFSVDAMQTDAATGQKETEWMNDKWPEYLGYYKKIPELKSSIDAKAVWTIGRGFKADNATTILLDNINGWGQDTFNSILKNMLVVRQISGDAFVEIIRNQETGTLINLKPLDPGSIKIIANEKGIIKRYEQVNKIAKPNKVIQTFQPKDMFHLTQDRVADEIHGTSKIESVEPIILARNEAVNDYKVVLHRNVKPVRIWHLDTDNDTKISKFITKVELMQDKTENIFVPKGAVIPELSAVPSNATLNPLPWIEYQSNFFFQAIGIPQIILGGSQEFTEATAKIAYLAFQQSVEEDQRDIEAQLWSQLAIKIELTFPASLENDLLSDEKKDAQPQAAQPADTTAGVGA